MKKKIKNDSLFQKILISLACVSTYAISCYILRASYFYKTLTKLLQNLKTLTKRFNMTDVKKAPYNDIDKEESDDKRESNSSGNFKDNIISKINDNCYMIRISVRDFIFKTKNWIYNREINKEKVNELFEHICSQKYKQGDSSDWIITLVYDEFADKGNFNNIVIDGQHRRDALSRAWENGKINENISIHCIMYEINYCETTNISKTINLFNSVNNNRPLTKIDYPHERSINLVNRIISDKELVPNASIVIKKNGKENGRGANQPFISEKELYNILYNNSTSWTPLTDEQCMDNIKIISKKISCVFYENIYTCNEKNKERYDKALNNNFWLNLKDSEKYGPDRWGKFIATPEQFS